jgi:glycerol-3-phosphate O-acyltransferase / dihydroxyacetone phosphate acyltransferase
LLPVTPWARRLRYGSFVRLLPCRHPVSRALTISLFQRVFRIYFRQIEAVELPTEGVQGRVFFANHANGIIDPALILCELPLMVSPLAKAPLFQMPFMAQLLAIAEAVPVHRKRDDPNKKADQNQGMFDSVGKHLQAGGNILIFPEGTSHSEPFVIPIKSGAARMLASAVAQGGQGLSFQAIGLEFDARESFRSRALLVGGPVRKLDDLGIEGSGEPLVAAITETMKEDLAELVVEGVSWHERRLIAQVAELLSHDAGDFSLEGWNVIGRKVERIRKTMASDEPLYERVSKTTGRYYTMLEAAGLSDEALLRNGKTRTPLSYVARLFLLPFALLAVPLYFVPYQLARLSYRIAGTEADVISTYKVAISLLAYPLWMLVLIAASAWLLPLPSSVIAAVVVIVAPLAALPWLDWLDRHPLWRNGAPTTEELHAARATAVAEIDAARHVLAPPEATVEAGSTDDLANGEQA